MRCAARGLSSRPCPSGGSAGASSIWCGTKRRRAGGRGKRYSALTGGLEPEKTPEVTACLEIEEEAGFLVEPADLIDLGVCRGTKSTDTVYRLFAANLTGRMQGEAKGDGSRLDAEGTVAWFDRPAAVSEDPLVAVLYLRLADILDRVRGQH